MPEAIDARALIKEVYSLALKSFHGVPGVPLMFAWAYLPKEISSSLEDPINNEQFTRR